MFRCRDRTRTRRGPVLITLGTVALALGLAASAAGARPDAAVPEAPDAGTASPPVAAPAPRDAAPLEVAPDAALPDSEPDAGVADPPPSGEVPAGPAAGDEDAGMASPVAEADPGAEPGSEAGRAIRIIVALVAILVLAYVAGDPRVQRMERQLRVSGLVTSGLPFVFIGVVISQPGIDVLSGSVLDQIRPFLPFGLGWIGFVIGIRFDLQRIVRLPRGIGVSAVITALLPFATITGAAAVMLVVTDGFTTDAIFLRNALLLGVAGLLGVRAARIRAPGVEFDRLAPLAQVQELIAIACLLVLAAFFRPVGSVGWEIPPIAWLFVTVGLGTLLGAMIYAILSEFEEGPEASLVMLGSIALAAGVASYLRLSPIAVCFIAAAMVGNFPGGWKETGVGALLRLERPIYLVFLVIVGALWQLGAWQGWVLLALFVAARFAGRWAGIAVARRQFPEELGPADRRRLVLAPIDALAVAIVVNGQDLYSGPMIPWLVTAVIGGAIATEIVVQIAGRGEEPVEAGVSHIAEVARAVAPRRADPRPPTVPGPDAEAVDDRPDGPEEEGR